ncbi:MAG: MBL fold metallo-hydrolase [Phycisphaerae bacterium]
MLTFSLQSGSNGNAIYVEADGVRLLFDAGISGVMAARRMAHHDRRIESIDALIVSHEHGDHVGCAGIYQRKFGLPIYMTRKTRDAARRRFRLGPLSDMRRFRAGDALCFGCVTVHTIPTPHDAVDGVAFVVEAEGRRLGILTDLGHPFSGLPGILESVDAAYLECNYDPHLLAHGDYPPHLKARIRGHGGHLSNEESATLLEACGRRRPKWIAVAHLSERNNRPELAIDAQREAVGRSYPVYHASRYGPSEMWTV